MWEVECVGECVFYKEGLFVVRLLFFVGFVYGGNLVGIIER